MDPSFSSPSVSALNQLERTLAQVLCLFVCVCVCLFVFVCDVVGTAWFDKWTVWSSFTRSNWSNSSSSSTSSTPSWCTWFVCLFVCLFAFAVNLFPLSHSHTREVAHLWLDGVICWWLMIGVFISKHPINQVRNGLTHAMGLQVSFSHFLWLSLSHTNGRSISLHPSHYWHTITVIIVKRIVTLLLLLLRVVCR